MKAIITIYMIHLHSSLNVYVQLNSNNHSLFTLKVKEKTILYILLQFCQQNGPFYRNSASCKCSKLYLV